MDRINLPQPSGVEFLNKKLGFIPLQKFFIL